MTHKKSALMKKVRSISADINVFKRPLMTEDLRKETGTIEVCWIKL